MAVDEQARSTPAMIDWDVTVPPVGGHFAGASGLNTTCVVKPAWDQSCCAFFAWSMSRLGTSHIGTGVGLGVGVGVADGFGVGVGAALALALGDADADADADGIGVTLAVGMLGTMPLRVG